MNVCHRKLYRRIALLVLLAGAHSPGLAEEASPATHPTSAWIVSPLFGVAENESHGQTDSSPEYGLFVMYASPRFVLNNTTFFTDVNNSEVWGDIASVSLYGDPKANLTWFLGGSYVWHQIQTKTVKVTINEPLGKVGVVWRIRPIHLSITPYIGYAQEFVTTEFPAAWHLNTDRDRSDLAVYGISAYWHWRMLGADAKYYLSQDLDENSVNHHFRVWATAMFSKQMGIITRFEYEEQNTSKDTSFLFGPVFVF